MKLHLRLGFGPGGKGTPGGGPPPPFVPTDIANLARWYDASDTATITHSSGAVDQWNDKSGNAQHATQTLTARPTTGTRTLNGLNVLDFDGTNDSLSMAGIDRTNGYTAFAVVENDAYAGFSDAIIGGLNSPGGGFALRINSSGLFGIVKVNTAVILDGAGALTVATPYRLYAVSSAAGNEVFVDNVSTGSNATNPAYTTDPTLIGTSGAPDQFFNGKIAEILVYTRVLTSTERNLVDAYLYAKWFVLAGLLVTFADASALTWANGSSVLWGA